MNSLNPEKKSNGNIYLEVLKWILVLPVSMIAWVIAYWVINLLYNIFSHVDISQWAITLMSSGGSGMAFVVSGSWIAPRGKKIVSVVLATIMVLFAIISLLLALNGYGENSTVVSVISALSTIAGCVLGSMQIYDEK